MNELALFAGAGGGILGGHLLGWRTVCAVEINDYARRVLLARQRDGMLSRFPIWDDITTFDGHPWHGRVDVISGGFPCQDISAAGKGAGITGERSGLWSHMARIIGEVRPRYVFVENSPLLVSRGLDTVLSDLAALGRDARWGIVGAHNVGAPHKRDRIWIWSELAYTKSVRTWNVGQNIGASFYEKHAPHNANCDCGGVGRHEYRKAMADTSGAGLEGRKQPGTLRNTRGGAQTYGPVSECGSPSGSAVSDADHGRCERCALFGLGESESEVCAQGLSGAGDYDSCQRGIWWESEPDVGRVAYGVASRVDRLKAIGNGQVPAVAALAWEVLS